MHNEFYKDLWLKAQENAKREYEEEWGEGSWDEADKYEREDYAFAEYERLGGFELEKKRQELEKVRKEFRNHRMPEILNSTNYTEWYNNHKEMHDKCAHKIFELQKEIKDMEMIRDSKGRFVKKANGNNETTNTNNKKENDIMMNRNNAKDNRMNKLTEAGIDTTNFFDLSMRVPMGAEIKIIVDGKEMVIPSQTPLSNRKLARVNNDWINTETGKVVGAVSKEEMLNLINTLDTRNARPEDLVTTDPIAQSIVNDGYVKNSSLFRRYIFAHTMKLINYVDRKNPNRKGWEAGFKDMYSYGYCFEMMADELHTLAKLQKEDPEYFAERTRFFNGNVTVALLEDYLYRLKKYCKKQMRENPKKYRGEQYVKLARYGNVLVKDLNNKVYIPICNGIADVRGAVSGNNYSLIEKTFRDFMNKLYNKLPYDTPKCAVFKDAYKGIGAFESLKNMCRWHNVVLDGCTDKYDSEARLYHLLDTEYKNEVWRFHQLLVETIENNNFDLRRSIAEGNCAPNTVSERAERY